MDTDPKAPLAAQCAGTVLIALALLFAGPASAVDIVLTSGTTGTTALNQSFPWTTGRVTISAPSAFGIPERFTLTGMDSRVNGVGTISLVSGALSTRPITSANANRGWLRLTVPEPGSLAGAAAALGTLAACHFLMRRRARRVGD